MNPRDFFELAERLARESGEAAQRTAISRGYYAVLHEARILVELCGFGLNGSEVHAKLPYCLTASSDPDLIFAARCLENLRRVRNQTDYDLESSAFSRAMVVLSNLRSAQDALDAIDSAQDRLIVFRPLIRQYAANTLKKVLIGDD